MLPLLVNLRDRACLVVGGGPVGIRKATTLLEAGAAVTLVCLEPRPDGVDTRLQWLTESYRSGHLDGIDFAVAAATHVVNERVVADARGRGIWVSSATGPETGNFAFPATNARRRVWVSVHTGGASPRLAALICHRLTDSLDDSVLSWVDLVAEVRREIRSMVPAEQRASILRRLTEPGWLDRIRAEGPEAVRRGMRAVVDEELGR